MGVDGSAGASLLSLTSNFPYYCDRTAGDLLDLRIEKDLTESNSYI